MRSPKSGTIYASCHGFGASAKNPPHRLLGLRLFERAGKNQTKKTSNSLTFFLTSLILALQVPPCLSILDYTNPISSAYTCTLVSLSHDPPRHAAPPQFPITLLSQKHIRLSSLIPPLASSRTYKPTVSISQSLAKVSPKVEWVGTSWTQRLKIIPWKSFFRRWIVDTIHRR